MLNNHGIGEVVCTLIDCNKDSNIDLNTLNEGHLGGYFSKLLSQVQYSNNANWYLMCDFLWRPLDHPLDGSLRWRSIIFSYKTYVNEADRGSLTNLTSAITTLAPPTDRLENRQLFVGLC